MRSLLAVERRSNKERLLAALSSEKWRAFEKSPTALNKLM